MSNPTSSPYFKTKELRIPPQSLEAEKALLGSIMIRPEVMHDITDIVNDLSFYSDRHKLIWLTMMELHGKNTPIDLLSLSARLKDKEMLEQTGGMSYLTEIVHGVPCGFDLVRYMTFTLTSTERRHHDRLVRRLQSPRQLPPNP